MLSKCLDGCRLRFGTIAAGVLGFLAYLVVVLLGCSCVVPPSPAYPALPPAGAVERVSVTCVWPAPALPVPGWPDSPSGAMGTGFAVGPRHAVTASHLASCRWETAVPGWFADGESMGTFMGSQEMVVEAEGADMRADASLLVAVGTGAPFPTWLPLRDEPVRPLEQVCVLTAVPERGTKCGYAVGLNLPGGGLFGEGYLAYRVATEPGNSGSPVVDREGRVVAVHVGSSAAGVAFGLPVAAWPFQVPEPDPEP